MNAQWITINLLFSILVFFETILAMTNAGVHTRIIFSTLEVDCALSTVDNATSVAYHLTKGAMEFIETTIFTKLVQELLTDDHHRELQTHLAGYPDAGVMIQDSGGLRKIRWASRKQGKRGGIRVIYYWALSGDLIYMIYVYSKTVQDDLTPGQLRTLRKFAKTELS